MIRIRRKLKDKLGKIIQPNDNWKKRAVIATKKAIKERKNHTPNNSIYGDSEVKKALEKLFHDKCAYCETKISAGFDWEVEHYRPKGEVAERPDHPGYYWLTYNWENLFPACVHCNQMRIDKPRWNENVNSRGGKSTHFPISNESNRAMIHLMKIRNEDPLLLNPCKDYPEKHFYYDPTGQIYPEKKSLKGLKTIDICHLKRSRLRKDRERILDNLIDFLKTRNDLKKLGFRKAYNKLDDVIKKGFLDEKCLYAGLARYVYKYTWKFGI
jgi:uncharacterized protein (TIGR02646 family)